MVALVLALPAVLLLDTPLDIAVSVAVAVGLWMLAAGTGASPARHLRTFIWLMPALVLANGLFGPAPRLWGIFSRGGLLLGLLVGFRLAWAAWMAFVLVRSCPPRELLASFRALLRAFRIPDRDVSLTLLLTLEMLPQFADIRVRDLRRLPEVIARRLRDAVPPGSVTDLPAAPRVHAGDLALVLPVALLVLLAALA